MSTLYLIATPIGNLADITQRALSILAAVDLIAVEDTRHSAKLLQHYGITTKKQSLHTHNEAQQSGALVAKLQQGDSIALISDAGTPLISDPGYQLVRLAQEQGVKIVPVPGPCAAIAALSVSGLPADRFVFEGFLPTKQQARCNKLSEFQQESRTMIFYEAPHRIIAMVEDVGTVFGVQREMTIARELTKKFETIHRTSAGAMLAWLKADADQQKGEFVVLVHGAASENQDLDEARRVLALLLPEVSVKQAASLAAQITGVSKNKCYEIAINS